jgi:hypothetical protein
MSEIRSFADERAYLIKYLAKYPDRVDLVNVIVAVHDLGALEPELLNMLICNAQHIARLSGRKEAFDARPTAYGRRVRGKKRKSAPVDLDEDEESETPDPVVRISKPAVLPASGKIHNVYALLKQHGQVSVADLIGKYGLYKTVRSIGSGAQSMSQVRKLLQADEVLLNSGEGLDRTYQLKKR